LAIKVKSTQWKKILDMEQKAKRKREEQLYIWGFLSFEMNRNLFKDLNKLNKNKKLIWGVGFFPTFFYLCFSGSLDAYGIRILEKIEKAVFLLGSYGGRYGRRL
jgi:hypothetical protein